MAVTQVVHAVRAVLTRAEVGVLLAVVGVQPALSALACRRVRGARHQNQPFRAAFFAAASVTFAASLAASAWASA